MSWRGLVAAGGWLPLACGGGSALQPQPQATPVSLVSTGTAEVAPAVPRVAHLVAGGDTSCVVMDDGGLRCWGFGAKGAHHAPEPFFPDLLEGVVQVSLADGHGCALDRAGDVWCWGLGPPTGRSESGFHPPARIEGLGRTKQLATARSHTCALGVDRKVRCWGTRGLAPHGLEPYWREVPGIEGDSGLATSWRGTCTIDGGFASCKLREEAAPRALGPADDLAMGSGGVVTLAGGRVRGWGSACGPGQQHWSTTPCERRDLGTVSALRSNEATYCARDDDGWKCWGKNSWDLMPSQQDWVREPTAIGVTGELQLGEWHACALKGDSRISCWGVGIWGQLGRGAPAWLGTRFSLPVGQAPPAPRDRASLGDGVACFVADGDVRCWGNVPVIELDEAGYATHSARELWTGRVLPDGAGSDRVLVFDWFALSFAGGRTRARHLARRPFIDLSNHVDQPFRDFAASEQAACAIVASGEVACTSGSTQARQLAGHEEKVANSQALAVGRDFACALNGGRVWCWGENVYGQLARPRGDRHPAPVAGLSNITRLTAGDFGACALDGDGRGWCWGASLPLRQQAHSERPRALQLPPLHDIAVGRDHACAAGRDGQMWCWGENNSGELGVDDLYDRAEPVRVARLDGAIAALVSPNTTCAVRAADTVCWGWGVSNLVAADWQVEYAPALVVGFGAEAPAVTPDVRPFPR